MNLVIAVFLLHFVADWVLQSPEMGRQKSNKFKVLCQHISIIFFVIFLGTIPLLGWKMAALLSLVNALTHAVVDWNIWRFYKTTVYFRNKDMFKEMGEERATAYLKRHYKYWLDPVFGYFLGTDQLIHYILLYVIYGMYYA